MVIKNSAILQVNYKLHLLFNFYSFLDGILQICCLIGYFFAYFELFQDAGFDGYFCNTFGIGFGFVFFAVEFECHCFLF